MLLTKSNGSAALTIQLMTFRHIPPRRTFPVATVSSSQGLPVFKSSINPILAHLLLRPSLTKTIGISESKELSELSIVSYDSVWKYDYLWIYLPETTLLQWSNSTSGSYYVLRFVHTSQWKSFKTFSTKLDILKWTKVQIRELQRTASSLSLRLIT